MSKISTMTASWMLGEFNVLFGQYVRREITLGEFCDSIEQLEEVPEMAKQNWRESFNDEVKNSGK